MTTPTTHLGRLVRTARRDAGLTQEQVAVNAGTTAKTVRSVEAGFSRRPQDRILRGLARALELDVDDLRHAQNADTRAHAETGKPAAA